MTRPAHIAACFESVRRYKDTHEMTKHQMGEPFYGTGEPPKGHSPGDYVELQCADGHWLRRPAPSWERICQYRLPADHHHYLPPVWCLDRAAQLNGHKNWEDFLQIATEGSRRAGIAHARTLQHGCEPMQEPVDPLVEAIMSVRGDGVLRSDAEIAEYLRTRFDITEKAK